MNAPKFTPGPWRIDGDDIRADDKTLVCECGLRRSLESAKNDVDANIALIAAAPELYAALRALCPSPGEAMPNIAQATTIGRAVLAKARGEA
jgi:hypothetical protein